MKKAELQIDLNTELTTDEAEIDEEDGGEELDLVAQLQQDLANTKDTLLRKSSRVRECAKASPKRTN